MIRVSGLTTKYGFLVWVDHKGHAQPYRLLMYALLRHVSGTPIDIWGRVLRDELEEINAKA